MWVTGVQSRRFEGASSLFGLRNKFFISLTTHRNATAITIKNKTAMLPAAIGCCVASQVRATARVSSPAESAKFEPAREPGHSDSGCCLAAMGCEGDDASGYCRQQLLFWRELRGCAVCHQCGYRDAHKGVQSIPEQIESWDLIGKKFNRKKHARGGDYPPTGDQVQSGGKSSTPAWASNPSVATVA